MDRAGNPEPPNPLPFKFDATPPAITLSLFPGAVIPVNGNVVTIAGYGKITDALSGFDRSSARFSVVDDYGTVQPSGAVTLYLYRGTDLYYFVLKLEAKLNDSDPSPRNYHITVTADDVAGNTGTATAVVSIVRPPG